MDDIEIFQEWNEKELNNGVFTENAHVGAAIAFAKYYHKKQLKLYGVGNSNRLREARGQKTHLDTDDIYEMAYEKLDVSNIAVNKDHELANMLSLEWDEKANAYLNPNIVIADVFTVNFCVKCDPTTSANTYMTKQEGTYLCKCGNKYTIDFSQE